MFKHVEKQYYSVFLKKLINNNLLIKKYFRYFTVILLNSNTY